MRTARKRNLRYKVLKAATCGSAVLAAAALAGVVVFILIRGVPHIDLHFLFGEFDVLGDRPSILPALISTAYLIGLTLAIVLPLGVGAAVYLNEYTRPGSRVVRIINVGVDTLSGIPSIVFGLFGMMFFCNLFGFGLSVLAGSFTLALINLPVVIRATQESLRDVPDSYREAGFALGAGRIRTIFKVVLPSALPGIVTAIILSVGRIIGESAAVMYTAGLNPIYIPTGPLDAGTNLAAAVYYFSLQQPDIAAATGVVLLVVVVGLNLAASWIGGRLMKNTGREGGGGARERYEFVSQERKTAG